MIRTTALGLAALLAGCAPSLVASSPGTVVVDQYLGTQATLDLATAECAKYGRTAVLRGTEPGGLGARRVFECR